MRFFFKQLMVFSLTFLLAFSPRVVQLAFAQEDKDSASDEEVRAVQQLAKVGYLGDKKEFYLTAKTLAEDDITDALLAIDDSISQVDVKGLKRGNSQYRLEDLNILLKLVEDKTDDIRARKVSAWKFENHLKKMITALSPATPAAGGAVSTPAPTETPLPTVVVPTPTATAIPSPSRQEWEDLKGTLKDLEKKTGDLQDAYDKKIDVIQKNNERIMNSNADQQEQLALVKKLLDRVQEDLKKTDEKLDQVAQKASEKNITDTELEQELTVMHKDLRDNTQDVSVLKQEVAKLDKANTATGESPLDQALNSKWLAGGALVVGLAALIISLTRK